MKKALLFAALSLVINVYCADDGFKDWMPRLKEIFGNDMPYKPTENKDLVRETKFPGERYYHFFNSNTTGTGRVIKKHFWWFDTGRSISFHNQVSIILREEIVSSQKELDDGIIKSKFTVQRFSEFMGNVKGKTDFGITDSTVLAKKILDFGKEHGRDLKDEGRRDLTKGTLEIVAVPDPIDKILGLTKVMKGALYLALHWFTTDYVPKKVDNDGFYKLDSDDVKKRYPAYKEIIEKIRNIEGTEITATWQVGVGYTEIKIKPAAHNIKEEDCELLAKMIYRMNPVGARSIIPKGKENNNYFTVNAADICGLVLPAGADYNTLSGSITFRNRGKDSMDYPDEVKNQRAETPIRRLSIADDFGSKITFGKKFKDGSLLTFTVAPRGKFEVATDEGKNGDAPVYVRHVEIEGDLNGEIIAGEGSFWSYMEIEKTSLEMKCVYNQLREKPLKDAPKTAK